MADDTATTIVDFRTDPKRYKHWKLAFDGPVATLVMDVREDGGLKPGYELKLNSYDLGVDIELYDAIQRLRFEHPEVRAVVLTSGKERIFCAGANIRMLAQSSHGWKVNFCKFTNETRNAIEEATAESGQAWICAIGGPCAGGGYELALACDWIVMADDRTTTVALPEVPLLGVLPGPRARRDHGGRTGGRSAPGPRGCPRPRLRVLAPGARARARRPDPPSPDERDRDRPLGAPHRGGRRPGGRLRPAPRRAPGGLA